MVLMGLTADGDGDFFERFSNVLTVSEKKKTYFKISKKQAYSRSTNTGMKRCSLLLN